MSIRRHGLQLLRTASAVVVVIMLNLGLWPFHAPRNAVTWLKDANGLSFKRHGTVFSLFRVPPSKATDSAARTIEVWLRAEPWHSGSFLSFYNSQRSVAVSMRESLTDFELIEYRPLSPRFRKETCFYASDVFRRPELTFITVTSGQAGIKLYVNGLITANARSVLTERAGFNGRVIAGDTPSHTDTWVGEIRGIAIYDAELSEMQIVKHYQTWKDRGRPTISAGDNISHLYLMDERGGSTIHDKIRPEVDLVVPKHYTVLGKIALEPVWNEFEISRSFARSTLKNIIGFVPFGICFYLLLLISEWKRPVSMVLMAGFSLSLTIEVLQIFLPTRDSGTTDLITNTLGTWFGVLTCQLIGPFRIISYFLSSNGYRRRSIGTASNKEVLTVSDRNK